MNRMLRFAVVLVGAFVVAAPALAQPAPAPAPAAAPAWPQSLNDYVAGVRKTIKTTDMDGYLAVVKNPNGAVLIDIREESEYKAGHIPGTKFIPRGLLEFQIWKALGFPNTVDMNTTIYVQCRTGGRATLAAAALKQIGFTNVTAVIMNIEDWEKKGNPWEK